MTASQLQSVDSDKAQPSGAVFAAAGLAKPNRRMFQNKSASGQTASVRGDQSVFSPTFDLSPPLLKPLIEGSRELSEKVQRDANWAD